jgi:tetraacyldisaccharide 4'-kinase
VVAVAGLTVGGSGKSGVARWLAGRAAERDRAAILLRGYGAVRRGGAEFVPDLEGLAAAPRVRRYGDDALAHRFALPRDVAVVVAADRLEGARAAIFGFGARTLVLDDGWEQDRLRWNELWIVLDPLRPEGNGGLLPAGPLRRPLETLREGTRIVFVLDGETALPETARQWAADHGLSAPILALRRVVRGVSGPGRPEVGPPPAKARVGLVSGVGAPARFEGLVRAQGLVVAGHAAFPNHAAWRPRALERAIGRLELAGVECVLITEKDEPRWPGGLRTRIPVQVLRTELQPLGSPASALEPIRSALAGGSTLG